MLCLFGFFFFQAEDGIRDRSPSRGLGDVYKRQGPRKATTPSVTLDMAPREVAHEGGEPLDALHGHHVVERRAQAAHGAVAGEIRQALRLGLLHEDGQELSLIHI